MYINDLIEVFPQSTTTKLFADDVKLYSEIKSDLDFIALQDSLDNLTQWARNWQLTISINKCYTLDVGRISSNIKPTLSKFTNFIDDTSIMSVKSCRDLGVIIDSKLSFVPHIQEIVEKAKQRMALLLRTFLTKDPHCLMSAFKSYILPIVDYCSQIWSPHHLKYILLVESVQRVFTKRIPCLKSSSYGERLAFLEITTLERRRLDADLILCYKILHGIISGPLDKYGLVMSERRSRGHALKLHVATDKLKTDERKYFFANRICQPWNSLPDDVVLAKNVKIFKQKLKSLSLNNFLLINFK